MTKLKKLILHPTTEVLGGNDRFWAHDVFDKALNPQYAQSHMAPMPALPYQNTGSNYGGMSSMRATSPLHARSDDGLKKVSDPVCCC